MRIQHNIMAMNSYRNLAGNNNALSKNLEKLSSGYRINRAGDDAAGLAISEKMRAQIAGLDQAQKNAQSGINLVKTAEGALTEVHDMLNRMVTLATQSANGTYGASDRQKLQAEVDALVEEIDRIAEHSNFNGTQLLNGDLSSPDEALGISGLKTGSSTTKAGFSAAPVFDPNTTQNIQFGDKYFKVGPAAEESSMVSVATEEEEGLTVSSGSGTKDDPYVIETTAETTNDEILQAIAAQITGDDAENPGTVKIGGKDFTVTFANSKLTFTATTKGEISNLKDMIENDVKTDIKSSTSVEDVEDVEDEDDELDGDAVAFSRTYTAGSAGTEGSEGAQAVYTIDLSGETLENGDKLTINETEITIESADNLDAVATAIGEALEGYEVTVNEGVFTITATDVGAVDGETAEQGNPSAVITYALAASDDGEKVAETGATVTTLGENADEGEEAKGAKMVATLTGLSGIDEGDVLTIGEKQYAITLDGESTEAGDGRVLLDLSEVAEGGVSAEELAAALNDLEGDDAPAADGFTVTVEASESGEALTVTIEGTSYNEEHTEMAMNDFAMYTAADDAAEVGFAPASMPAVAAEPRVADTSSANTTSSELGASLTLQIGAGRNETIDVKIKSMKAVALGIKDLDIGDEIKANEAIETINAAIEKVSVQRGELGAIQNRLEHTINNLGVMEENIQDAEANIRDTDIADEMMAYTKNNILIQSAQAMLAQANQVPQGVLQLMG